MPQVVTLTAALANPAEHRKAAMLVGDVADQLIDDNGLAHTGATKHAHFPTSWEGGEQIERLDARFEQLDVDRLLSETWRRAVDRGIVAALDGAEAVDWLAQDVHNTTEHRLVGRYGDRLSRVVSQEPAPQPFGGAHGDAADRLVAKLLLYLGDHAPAFRQGDANGLIDGRRGVLRKANVDHRANNLCDNAAPSFGHWGPPACWTASAPPMMSSISLVMVCCLALL